MENEFNEHMVKPSETETIIDMGNAEEPRKSTRKEIGFLFCFLGLVVLIGSSGLIYVEILKSNSEKFHTLLSTAQEEYMNATEKAYEKYPDDFPCDWIKESFYSDIPENPTIDQKEIIKLRKITDEQITGYIATAVQFFFLYLFKG